MGITRVYRFGVFLFDRDQLQLLRDGQVVRLQRQPAQVLAALLEGAGHVVTREELRRAVWSDDTFVDFERGLNFCIAQVRSALSDDATTPRYVRTSPKRGYEFICPVQVVPFQQSAPGEFGNAAPERSIRGPGRWLMAAIVVALMSVLAGVAARYAASARPGRVIVAVARFDNETGDAALTAFSDALTDSVVEQLTLNGAGRYDVVGNAAILRGPRDQRDLRTIATSLHTSYVVLGQVQRDAQHVRVLGHLIRLPDQTHVAVSRFDDVQDETLAGATALATRMVRKFDLASRLSVSR
jgi:DNA-binding winged helix-turn-helix (wHTH) protein/TolB-like protein